MREAWFGRGGGAEEGNGGPCDGFPVDEAAAHVGVEEGHRKEVAFLAGMKAESLKTGVARWFQLARASRTSSGAAGQAALL